MTLAQSFSSFKCQRLQENQHVHGSVSLEQSLDGLPQNQGRGETLLSAAIIFFLYNIQVHKSFQAFWIKLEKNSIRPTESFATDLSSPVCHFCFLHTCKSQSKTPFHQKQLLFLFLLFLKCSFCAISPTHILQNFFSLYSALILTCSSISNSSQCLWLLSLACLIVSNLMASL